MNESNCPFYTKAVRVRETMGLTDGNEHPSGCLQVSLGIPTRSPCTCSDGHLSPDGSLHTTRGLNSAPLPLASCL